MKRTIHNNSIRLETEITLNGYTVQGRKRSKAVYQSQSARSGKSNSIQRNMAKLENLETKLMNIAFKAKRSELQRSERMAKREARLNG
jgi:acyl-CoA thioesterase